MARRAFLPTLALCALLAGCAALPGGDEEAEQVTWTTLVDEATLIATAAESDRVTTTVVGESVQGNPIRAVTLGNPARPTDRAALMLIGAQHGDEPAGREAILEFIAGLPDSTDNDLLDFLAEWPIVAVPTANPDGIDADQRKNANDEDLNRDHVRLSQPETRTLHALIARTQPAVILDMHESYVSIDPNHLIEFARGYHPQIHPHVADTSADLLDALLDRATAESYPNGEYSSATADDPRSLRNAAALADHPIVITETNANNDDPADRAERVAAQAASLDETLMYVTDNVAGVVTGNDSAGVEQQWPQRPLGYTPELTAAGTDPNVGADGVINGYWRRDGLWVSGSVRILADGDGQAGGSGRLMVTLPLPADTDLVDTSASAVKGHTVGSGFFRHPATGGPESRTLHVQPDSATTVRFFYDGSNNALDGDDLDSDGWRIDFDFAYPVAPAG